ncbi:MAG: NIPSNAP family protein [bacterium]
MTTSGIHDFDFLHGEWRVHNRKLRHRLVGSTDWYEFDGRATERALWGGQANIEEYEATLPNGDVVRGLALRLYQPETKRWTIQWSGSATGTLDAPMTGTFADGRGVFYGHEDCEGRAVFTRFIWTSASDSSARWEQAFSADGGSTWETNWVMDFTRVDAEKNGNAVIELRKYAMQPGARDTLIEIFEREFVTGQEAVGMEVIAQFRDLDEPDVFTWLRGFRDMKSRDEALTAFYSGPVWLSNRSAANETLIDSDNVYLLRPARAGSGFVHTGCTHRTAVTPRELVVATIYTLSAPASTWFTSLFERTIAPLLTEHDARPIAMLETEPSVNSYPRLPVREGEHVFVWFAQFDDADAYDRHLATLDADPRWREFVGPALARELVAPVEIMRLVPTALSRELR